MFFTLFLCFGYYLLKLGWTQCHEVYSDVYADFLFIFLLTENALKSIRRIQKKNLHCKRNWEFRKITPLHNGVKMN